MTPSDPDASEAQTDTLIVVAWSLAMVVAAAAAKAPQATQATQAAPTTQQTSTSTSTK